MRLRLLALLAAICSITVNAQEEVESKQIKIIEQSPSAPNTASLGKYFDVPVNMSTGVPSIQIPLYVIKTGGITIPITLSYHSAGNKVNNAASWVGFGWDLRCGGVISKQVNGLDDFYSMTHFPDPPGGIPVPAWSTYMNPDYTMDNNLGITSMTGVIDTIQAGFNTIPGNADLIYRLLGRIILNKYDGEPDEYNFSTPEGSGSIFYNQKTTQFEASELNGIKASFDSYNNTWNIQQKDGKGFYFADKEEALSPYYESAPGPYPMGTFTSAWYLTGIDDPVNGRGVSFEYDYSAMGPLSNVRVYSEDWNTSYPASYAGGSSRDVIRIGKQLNVKRINFPEGYILFVKDTAGRLDGGVNALRFIRIYDKNNVLKKEFELKYFYAWSGTANTTRLFLKSVQEINYISGLASDSRPYSISYDTTAVMPKRFSYAQDIWGYNNGKTANTSNIPTLPELTQLGIIPHANRNVDTNYTKSGIIKQIAYPTGGSLNFTFENNKDGNDSLVGGLRIKRILNYDSVASKSLITEYRYNDDNNHSTGIVASRPQFHYYFDNGTIGTALCRIGGDPVYPLFGNQGSPVTYTRVEKVEIGDGLELKSRHHFFSDLSGFNISPDAIYRNANIGVPFNKMADLQRFSYHPYSTEVYKKVLPNGPYKIIKKDIQEYDVLNGFKKYIWGIQAAWGMTGWDAWVVWPGQDPYAYSPMFPIPYVNGYKIFQDNTVNTVSTSETTDDNNQVIRQKVYRVFDTLNGNLRKITTVASSGDTLRTYLKYTSNYAATTSTDPVNQQINYLHNNNILASPVEILRTTQTPGSSEILMDADLYFYDNGKIKKVLKVTDDVLFSGFIQSYNNNTAFYYDSRYKLESEIELYNTSKNPVQIKLKDKVQSLIWDGDDILATVINSNAANIAFSSFETTEKGNWNYTGSVVVDNTVPSGYKGYNLSTGSITNSVIDGSKPYVISYWSNNGSKTVNSTSGIAGRSVNGWTYYEHNIASTAGQVTVSGSGLIDELRLYPKGAFMSTYSYIPLIGIKNQCDANNSISYYEYDGMGRLVIVRDQDKNVIKKVCYNYAGQPENCTYNCINTNAVWQNTSTALRCQQGANGNTGYQEQEQKDVNPCSSTYNQIQWSVTGQNTTACPVSTNIAITYSNTAGVSGFTALYTNKTTGQTFSFPVPTGSGTLGYIPPAKYSLTITKSGNNILYTFGCGCLTTSGTSASFSNVNAGSAFCRTVTIENGL